MRRNNLLSRIGALMMALCLIASLSLTAFAATVDEAIIDEDAECSITIYKYDRTNASKDGAWDGSYVSTGRGDSAFQETMGNSVPKGDYTGDAQTPLHNGAVQYGYAIAGVEFSYLKVADIVTYTEVEEVDGKLTNLTMVLYGFDKTASADLLSAIGLADGKGRYEKADTSAKLDGANNYYYDSDTLNAALAAALASNETTLKNALEDYIVAATEGVDASVGGQMPLTDSYGYTYANGLKVGLYLLVETKVPSNVTSAVAPFFLSLPSTDVSGSNWTEGGHNWMYDVTLYPKNSTGIVELEKLVRESKADTGTHGNSSYGEYFITDGWSHNATGSAGDIMDYMIVSSLPSITSESTNLCEFTFHDELCEGLTYTKGDVTVSWFADKDCATTPVAVWDENCGMIAVTYYNDNAMTIAMTQKGLAAINARNTDDSNANDKGDAADGTPLYAAFSNYTCVIRYSAKVNSDSSFVYGEAGNVNTVWLTWRRTSSDYFDMLLDDCHVYSFGMEITKMFVDKTPEEASEVDAETGKCLYDYIKFILQNETDGYYVQAELNETEGVYYVTGHTTEEAKATSFVPVTAYPGTENELHGKIIVKGLEDDTYILTETETADTYALLENPLTFTISIAEDTERPCDVYAGEDKLGVYQNDGHYYFGEGEPNIPLANMPQKQLAHLRLCATAIVDTNEIVMYNDTDPATGTDLVVDTDAEGEPVYSENALVPLAILNKHGWGLPNSGEPSTLLYTIGGTVAVLTGAYIFVAYLAKKKKETK